MTYPIMDKIRAGWRALLRYLKPPRFLIFTRFGTTVVLLTIGVGLGAMNTGNNLVYMIFGMMLGFITASGVSAKSLSAVLSLMKEKSSSSFLPRLPC